MKRRHVYGITLFAFAVLQIGFFVMAPSAVSVALPKYDYNAEGGGPQPEIMTVTSTQTITTECGETTTIVVTETYRLFAGGYRLVQVIEDGTFNTPITNMTHEWLEVTEYERDLEGVLRGVIGFEEGSEFRTSNPAGYVTNYTEGESYNLYPGEVAKIAKMTHHQTHYDSSFPVDTNTAEMTTQYEYDTSGNLLRVTGGYVGIIADESNELLSRGSAVYQYTLIGGVPLLSHVEYHGHTEDLGDSSDSRGSFDYNYDGAGNLVSVTTPGQESLHTSGYPGPYGAIWDTQMTFVIIREKPYQSTVCSAGTDWDRNTGVTCVYTTDGIFVWDECGRLLDGDITGYQDCSKGGSSVEGSSPPMALVCEGENCVSVDEKTAAHLELIKKTLRPEILKPKVEVRLGSKTPKK